MTAFAAAGYPRIVSGGRAIPDLAQHPAGADSAEEAAPDLGRLQQAIVTLVERYHALRAENEALRGRLAEREERLRELNQRRQDTIKRIDDLVAQIDELGERLEPAP